MTRGRHISRHDGEYSGQYEILGSMVEIEIGYTYDPGYPETGPSYACGGEPGVPASAELNTIRVRLLKEEKVYTRTESGLITATRVKYVPDGEWHTPDDVLDTIIRYSDEVEEDVISDAEDVE